MTLAEFLLARIADDEQQAREAIAERERVAPSYPVPDMDFRAWSDTGVPAVLVGAERVLAECEAKRHVIELHYSWELHAAGAPLLEVQAGAAEAILRVLATVYADHPDYQEEWAL